MAYEILVSSSLPELKVLVKQRAPYGWETSGDVLPVGETMLYQLIVK